MSVKIRLARLGTKNSPIYRIVATDSRSKRDGKTLEILGTYNPRSKQAVQFHEDRIQAWLNTGACMTDTVKKIHASYRRAQNTAQTAEQVSKNSQAQNSQA